MFFLLFDNWNGSFRYSPLERTATMLYLEYNGGDGMDYQMFAKLFNDASEDVKRQIDDILTECQSLLGSPAEPLDIAHKTSLYDSSAHLP